MSKTNIEWTKKVRTPWDEGFDPMVFNILDAFMRKVLESRDGWRFYETETNELLDKHSSQGQFEHIINSNYWVREFTYFLIEQYVDLIYEYDPILNVLEDMLTQVTRDT